jgi:hypothetical protein
MANVIGNLLIELGLNTASFHSGMEKAADESRSGAVKITEGFKGIGEALRGVTSQFGAFGGTIGVQLSGVTRAVSEVARGMGNLEGASGAMKLGLGGFGALAVGAVAAGAGVLAVGMHAASAAAKLYLLSEATGVDVQTLSGMSVVAKAVDVNLETLTKGLMRMSTAALRAAESPQSTSNAFLQLGISVTDASGHLKPALTLFGEIADKFAKMHDGSMKTALGMQLFGRMAGAELIPVLNRGGKELQAWVQYGKDVGYVLSNEDAKSAEDFQEKLVAVSVATQGFENRIMIGLIPAMNKLLSGIDSLVGDGPRVEALGNEVGAAMVGIAKGSLGAAVGVQLLARSFLTATDYAGRLFHRKGSKAYDEITNDIARQNDAVLSFQATVSSALEALRSTGTVLPTLPKAKPDEGPKPKQPAIVPYPAVDYLQGLLDKTSLMTEEELALAGSFDAGSAALMRQRADAQAANAMLQVRIELQRQLKEYTQRADDAMRLGEANRAAAYRVTVKELQDQLVQLDANRSKITAMYESTSIARFLANVGKAMDEQNDKLRDHVEALKEMAAAVPKGGPAVIEARIDEKTIEDRARLRDAEEDVANANLFDVETSARLLIALEKVTEEYNKHREALRADMIAQEALNAAVAKAAADVQVKGIKLETAALFENAAARREAAVQAKLLAYQQAHPELGATIEAGKGAAPGSVAAKAAKEAADAIADESARLRELSDEQHKRSLAEMAAGMDSRLVYDSKKAELNEIIELYGKQNKAIAANAAADKLALRKQFDENTIATGGFTRGFKALLDELAVSGSRIATTAGALKTLDTGIRGAENSLARFIVTGRGGFLAVIQQMEVSLVRLGIQFILAHTLLKLFRDSADKQATAKLAMSMVTKQAAIGQAAAEAAAFAAWGGPGAAIAAAAETLAALEGITALAGGGDVMPGKAYIVGEKRPELFVPGMAGKVLPSVPREVGSHGGGPQVHITHAPTINAFDTAGLDALLQRHAGLFERHVERAIRMRNF